jgi:hypothetical protein
VKQDSFSREFREALLWMREVFFEDIHEKHDSSVDTRGGSTVVIGFPCLCRKKHRVRENQGEQHVVIGNTNASDVRSDIDRSSPPARVVRASTLSLTSVFHAMAYGFLLCHDNHVGYAPGGTRREMRKEVVAPLSLFIQEPADEIEAMLARMVLLKITIYKLCDAPLFFHPLWPHNVRSPKDALFLN